MPWGTPIEQEVRRRITVAVAAYAYEVLDISIMADHDFDRLAQTINPQQGTCHPLLDEFFAHRFSPMTGMWIHDHPELPKIKAIFERWYSGVVKEAYERGRAKEAAKARAAAAAA